MADIDIVRSIISDKPVWSAQTFVGDGSNTLFQVDFYPLVPASVTVDPDAMIDPDDDTGVISFGTPPTNGVAFKVRYKSTLLSDDDIQAFLTLESASDGYLKLAAADALDAIASNEALIQKKIKVLDLETDGPALARVLQAQAKELRKQVFDPEYVETAWDVAEQVNNTAQLEEFLFKELQREGW